VTRSNRLAGAVVGCLLLSAAVGAAQNARHTAEKWIQPTASGHLTGTMLIPTGDGPWPVALILAGSGPHENNSPKQLAEGLAAAGVASLRVDQLIADAAAGCERLQADSRFSSLTVVGYGQGAHVGMNAAWLSDAAGFVAINSLGSAQFDRSADRYDPLVALARLPLPVLVMHDTTGGNVTAAAAVELADARPGARLLLVQSMSGDLKMVAAVTDLVWEADRAAAARAAARDAVTTRAAAGQRLLTPAAEDSVLAAEFARATATKVGLWARRFADADNVNYLFGPKVGGYVAEGDIVSDRRQDCVSLLYRVGELARARSAHDAVDWALRTRFAGAGIDVVTDGEGRLDYDDPAHLDYSLDMIRTGMWGRNVTETLSGAAVDTVGSSRYRAGSFRYVPKQALQYAQLAEGDIAWFVLDAGHASGAKLRREYGLVIGHIGIVVIDEGRRWLIHAANSDLSGWYEGGTVVRVPLQEYLSRVDKFAGVMVTRF